MRYAWILRIVVMIPSDLGAARAAARAELLEPVLAKMLQANVEVRVAASYREILDAIVGGTVDLAWAPPTVCARSAASAVFFAGVERGGRRSYRAAVLGARRGGGSRCRPDACSARGSARLARARRRAASRR